MKNFKVALPLFLCLLPTLSAKALQRDAAATLNRCGEPLLGDETIFENSLAGGRRILKYGRGTLYFDRLANTGWTFKYGVHRGSNQLNATQMAVFMPCLTDALADSAAAAPLHPITSFGRAEDSLKRAYQTIVAITLAALITLGGVFFLASRRSSVKEEAAV